MPSDKVINIGDVCTYSFDNTNKSVSIVEVVKELSEEVVVVKFHQVIFDDSGNHLFTYLCENDKTMNVSKKYLTKIDLINRQFYKLEGVMHSVDKWLEGDELKGDEVQRACTMREKTLRITEQQKAEIERLTNKLEQREEMMANLGVELTSMRGAANSYKMHYEKAQAETEKYQHIEQTVKDFWSELKKMSAFKDLQEPTLTELLEYIDYANAEAIKEFADKAIKRICERVVAPIPSQSYIVERCNEEIHNLSKELEDKI